MNNESNKKNETSYLRRSCCIVSLHLNNHGAFAELIQHYHSNFFLSVLRKIQVPLHRLTN